MRLPVLLALAALLATEPALAADHDLPGIDPPDHWRRLSRDDYASTSRCIGHPGTPLCAVETLLACFQRGQEDLCKMVDETADQYDQIFSAPVDLSRGLAYRVVEARRLNDGASPPNMKTQVRPGDILIGLDQRETLLDQPPEDPPGIADFVLRRADDGTWKIVYWGEPGKD